MAHISSLMNLDELEELEASGYVRSQRHPKFPLQILNYTQKAAYENVWTDVTRQCRGLIIGEDGTIFARPFPKFFNYGQDGAPEVELNEHVIVTDKLDGSLGILYGYGYDWRIATRGSFTSDQALHATEVFKERYRNWEMNRYMTFLFEIIYPENRIVCDYGKTDDLVMLGAVDNATGRWLGLDYTDADRWPGPTTIEFDYFTFGEALSAKPRPNAEGFVIYVPRIDDRIKVKQEDYIRLHRIITGLTARTVWEAIKDDELESLLEAVPDEFHEWIREVESELQQKYDTVCGDIADTYRVICLELAEEYIATGRTASRREFAEKATQFPFAWALFMLLDRAPQTKIHDRIWEQLKPPAGLTPTSLLSEEVE